LLLALEEAGVGRPSKYAPTMRLLQVRWKPLLFAQQQADYAVRRSALIVQIRDVLYADFWCSDTLGSGWSGLQPDQQPYSWCL
jgi:hypothetical protein